ncbi:MAG: hypothetical protein AVDCRST_MAG57-1579 [uncultured Blastococcus sp.]|uniref:Thiopeptide-type bacteriocin biosynthesis domain-containing protein n=1 Tax=uncultured Blastococcus sp. TaxID=217144 RepID=A0A6J4I592_9ACTN|nr:MAG: hypothetical protein AVDCRST_MAG57-1579 [uncultured Blastococcus sp.]
MSTGARTGPDALPPLPDDVVGVRLYRRSPVDASWLAGSIVPVLRGLHQDDGAAVAYLRPGWLHGPHVDVVARAQAGEPALPWLEVARRLDAGPEHQAPALAESDYLTQARELGRMEQVPPPYLPMQPHGAIAWVREGDLTPWPAPLGALRELVLTRLSQPLADAAEQLAHDPASAARRLAEVFVALADSHRWGASFGVFSLRSHAEAFLSWAAPTADARPAFARRLQRDAPWLREVVEQSLSGRAGRHAGQWRVALAYSTGVLDAAVAAGTLDGGVVDALAGTYDGATMGPPGQQPGSQTEPSAFHRRVAAAGVTDRPPDWFAAFRILLNLTYQQLPLLGLPPIQRYYYCYAVAELVDEVVGESWEDRLQRVERRHERVAG